MATEGTLGPALKNKEVLDKARAEINSALELRRQQAEEQNREDDAKPAVPTALGHVDIALTYMELYELPEELIDIVKDEMTRMSLHHNRLTGLSGLSTRIHECTNLRYLVMRENKIHDFPTCILSLPNLELLDLKRNKLVALPEDLDRLSQLKFFSVIQNQLRRVPGCLSKMNLLTKFEASDNPIEFPPKSEWIVNTSKNGEDRVLTSQEQDIVCQEETIKLKKYLRVYKREQARREADGQSSDGTLDTPRASRRKTSGRFPIKPSVSGIEQQIEYVPPSPRLPKPPPLPLKAQARQSNQPINAAAVRPGLSPLVTTNERNRSNSESGVQTSVREKRMGFHVKQLGQEKVDFEKSNRLSHLRGLSHGSVLQSNMAAIGDESSSPSSLLDHNLRRHDVLRRLSSLPEGKRKSRMEDPLLSLARGLLYSLLQVFNPIKHLIKGLNSSVSKRTGLDSRLTYSWSMLEELNRKLSSTENAAEDEDEDTRRDSLQPIHESCKACVAAFEQLLYALRRHIQELVLYSSQEYVRTLMHLLYASIIEVRICCSKMAAEHSRLTAKSKVQASNHFSQSQPFEDGQRPTTSLRVTGSNHSHRNNNAPNLQESGKMIHNPALGEPISRSASNWSLSNATDGLVAPPLSRSNTTRSVEDEELHQFERIWKKVDFVSRSTYDALKQVYKMVVNIRLEAGDRASDEDLAVYDQIIDRCKRAMDITENLRHSLRSLQVKDPALKSQFWATVTAFTKEYVVFVATVREVSKRLPDFPDEVKRYLKPVQQGHKDLGRAIHASPWSQFATLSQSISRSNSTKMTNPGLAQATSTLVPNTRPVPRLGLQTGGPLLPPNPLDPVSSVSNVSSNGNSVVSSGYVTPLPATPMSAALGPAAVATLPIVPDSQPSSTSFLGGELKLGTAVPQSSGGPFDRSRSVSQRR